MSLDAFAVGAQATTGQAGSLQANPVDQNDVYGDAPLTLGSVQFTQDECPEELAFPATQSLAIHDLPGGVRRIQPMGVVWKPITWEGIFRDNTAFIRSELLSRMKADASVQRLTYLNFAFDVLVEDYTPTVKNPNRIDFKIQCQVLKDASGKATISTPTSIDSQNNVANQNAIGHLNNLQVIDPSASSLQTPVSNMGQALDAAGPAAQATGPTALQATNSILSAVQAVSSYQQLLPSQATSTQIFETQQLLANLQIIQKNYATGQAPKTIQVAGGTLHDIASQYYGDASLAQSLMAANGLVSPFLPHGVTTTLTLPPLQTPSVSTFL